MRADVIAASTVPPATGPAGEVMPLVGYSPVWLLLGLALPVAIAAYYLLVAAANRRRVEEIVIPVVAAREDPSRVRIRVREGIDTVERRARHGTLGPRAAHEELSALVREYVTVATGIPADRMTLADLERSPLRGTAAAVARFYPGLFAAEATDDVDGAIRAAREVLDGWP